jgi:hypothetical protein
MSVDEYEIRRESWVDFDIDREREVKSVSYSVRSVKRFAFSDSKDVVITLLLFVSTVLFMSLAVLSSVDVVLRTCFAVVAMVFFVFVGWFLGGQNAGVLNRFRTRAGAERYVEFLKKNE